MRLNQVTVPVTDIPRAVEFYLMLGLKQIVASSDYARFVCPDGDATFSVEKVDAATPGVVVYFECEPPRRPALALARGALPRSRWKSNLPLFRREEPPAPTVGARSAAPILITLEISIPLEARPRGRPYASGLNCLESCRP